MIRASRLRRTVLRRRSWSPQTSPPVLVTPLSQLPHRRRNISATMADDRLDGPLAACRVVPARALEGRDLPPLPSSTPLPAARGLEPAGLFGPVNGRCRDFPNKKERTITLRCALLLRASAPVDRSLLRPARRLIVRVSGCPLPLVTAIPARRDDGSLQHLSKIALATALFIWRGWRPRSAIAVALSGDSQQHERLGHGGQTDFGEMAG
ncbi:hypothetical protein FHX15_005205 [Rhizobium sp. BK650]|nr:hypothetical protein [Rhizobium sp. BK650]